jgi:CHRD domain
MARAKSRLIVMTLVLAGALTISLMAQAGPFRGHADLSGYQENPTLSSPATGTADVQISRDGQSVSYTLTYEGIGTNVLFAHIHLGRPAINGGIMVFLCTNGTPPAGVPSPPACPQNGGTVSGTLTAGHVLATTNPPQGVAAGEFAEFVQALRAEAAYVNVHSAAFGAGEIRGQVTFNRADSVSDD